MKTPETSALPAASGSDAVLRCGKCRHENVAGARVCSQCGAHLHLRCRKCGHVNQRSRRRCTECRQRLHRSTWKRFRSKYLSAGKIRTQEVLLAAVVILMIYLYVRHLGNSSPFPPPPPPSD